MIFRGKIFRGNLLQRFQASFIFGKTTSFIFEAKKFDFSILINISFQE
jgi:hypothetical protein